MADSTPGAVATPEEEGYWAPAAQASTPAATEPAKPIAQSPEHEDYWAPASRATPAPSDESYWTTPAQDNTPAPTPVVAPPGNTIQAAPPQTLWQQTKQQVDDFASNSALGRGLESTMPKVADLLHLHPSETVNSPTYQQDQEQLVSPQYLAHGSGKTGPNGEPSKFSDVASGAGEAVGGLTTPGMLAAAAIPVGELAGLFGATGAKLIPRLVSAGFTATMLKGLYDKVGPFRDAIHRGDYATARQLAGQAIVEAPLAAATALHAARGSHVAQPSSGEPAIPTAQPTAEPQPLAKEPVTGREVLQPNATPAKLNKAAKQEAPALEDGLKKAVDPIPGARVDAVRPSKNPERIRQKIEEEGQPANTIPDYLASRVVVDSPAARTAAVSAIKAQFPTVRDVDQFNDGDEDFGYRVHKLQVNTPSGLTAEVHIVPKEVADINADEHMNYKKARQADITGSDKQFDAAAKKAKDANDAAMEAFNKRNALEPTSQAPTPEPEGGRGESPEQEQPAVSKPATPATPKAGSYALLNDGSVGRVDYYNEGMNRGRMTTVDGRKLPTVRGADMTPLAEVNPGKEATGTPLEKELAERNKSDGPKLLAQYLKDNVYHGIPSVSTDAAKSLYPEYVADPTKTNADVNQAAAAIADAAWRTLISRPPVEGKEIVRVLTGSPASGKTTMVREGGTGSNIGINREAILQDLPYASKLVDDVINSGRVPEIMMAFTRDPKENVRRAVTRATQSGRPVPIDYMAKAYVTVPKIISALADKYGDKIRVDSWDTTDNKPVTHKGTAQPAVEATGKYTEQTAREAMLDELRHLRTQGKVSEKLYEAFTGPSLAETAAGHPGQVDAEAGRGARGERKDDDRGADAGRGRQEGVRLDGTSDSGQHADERAGKLDEGTLYERGPLDGDGRVSSVLGESGRSIAVRGSALRQPERAAVGVHGDRSKLDATTGAQAEAKRESTSAGGPVEARAEEGAEASTKGQVNGNVSDERTEESVPEKKQQASNEPSREGEGSVGVGSREVHRGGVDVLLRGSGDAGEGKGTAEGVSGEGKKGGVDATDGTEAVRTAERNEGQRTGSPNRAGDEEGRSKPTGLQPGEVGRVPISELTADPKRFQYKLNTDESGATNKLKDVPWDDELSGSIWAWRDPEDGKLYVVNGHHRFDLARRGGAKDMAVRVFGEDVKTAQQARVRGALQNIAEGNGTAVDAAKFMRDTGMTDLKKFGVSPDGPVAGGGMALANLDQKLFDDVVAGRIPEKRGIAIGRAAETPEQQEALVKLLAKAEARGKHITNATIEELGRLVKSSGASSSTQDSLFGSFETTKNLALEKAEVSDHIRRQIGTEKRLFGGLSSETKASALEAGENKINAKGNKAVAEKATQAQELYDKLSTKTGPINDILDAASKQLAEGQNEREVKARAYKDARAALAEVIRGGAETTREVAKAGYPASEAREASEPAGDRPLSKSKQLAATLTKAGKKVKTADEIKPGVAFRQGEEVGPTWYLKSERLIDQKMKGPMSGPDVLRMLENGGVKRDELKWTGLEDALKGKFRVKPEEVKQAIAEGGIQIQEVTKGGPTHLVVGTREGGDPIIVGSPDRTKYESYQLPGGENYREMLLTMPSKTTHRDFQMKEDPALMERIDKAAAHLNEIGEPNKNPEDWRFWSGVHTELLNQRDREVSRQFKAFKGEDFQSGHWDEPNILAHIRFNDRVTPEGKKLLHIEEIQSDWHQKGRDKGYKGDPDVDRAGWKAYRTGESGWQIFDHNRQFIDQLRAPEASSEEEAVKKAIDPKDRDRVPAAPFKKDWHEMAFRRAVRYAAENNYDGVSWTPGEKQAERYDLSKQVKSLHYYPEARELTAIPVKQSDAINYTDVAPEKLADYVGKEGARKLLEQPIDETGAHRLEGVDMKLGGEGMKGFYDKIIPDYARKFGKQWGAKVGEVELSKTEDQHNAVRTLDEAIAHPDDWREDDIQRMIAKRDQLVAKNGEKVPTLDITPSMRKSVVEEGVPMFKGKTPKELMQEASRMAPHAEFEVVPGDKAAGHVDHVSINSFAREVLNAVDPTLAEGGKWHGVTLPEGYAKQTMDQLTFAAVDMMNRGEEEQARQLGRMVVALHDSADADGNVIILHGPNADGAIDEEQFHSYQLRSGAALGEVAFEMGQSPEIRKSQKFLVKKGYPDDPANTAMEATAKAAAGDWEGAGLTFSEAKRLMREFFDAVAKTRGPEALENVPAINKDLESTLTEAREEYDRQASVYEQEAVVNPAEAGAPAPKQKAWPELAKASRRLQSGNDAGGAGEEHRQSVAGDQGRLFKRAATPTEPVEEKDEDALDRLTSKTKALDTKKQTLAEKLGKSAKKSVTAVTENVTRAGEIKDDILRNGKEMLQHLVKPRPWTDYDAITGEFQGKEQKADLAMAEYAKEIKRVVPDKIRREAITNWIQANGDKDLLKERARMSKAKYRDGYKLAAELTPDEVAIAKGMRQYMNEQFDAGLKAGLDVHFANLYMSQIYEDDAKGLKSLINFGELAPNPAFIKQRFFQNYYEAEQAGHQPKDKDAAFLLTAYHDSFTKAVSSRAYIRSLLEGKAEDGRPLAILDTNGAYVQISPDQERYVITPKPRPDDLAKYRHVDHPALRNWKWDLSDKEAEEVNPKLFEDSTKALVKSGDLMLHPDIATRVQNILSKSAIQENPIGRVALAVSSSLKHTLLSFSGFHQVQETIHALGHKTNPLNMVKLDLRDKKQYDLASHGLLVADFSGQQAFSEGVSGGALVNYIPVIGDAMAAYQHYLFRDYIPRLKMTMALHALERNTVRYAGKLDRDQILRLTADQSNAAFGGQNQKMMGDLGTNKTFQDITRLLLLAPDFLYSRLKFAGQALLPYGMEQRAALVRSALVMYAGARILNYILNDGDAKFDRKDAFAVVYKGKSYSVRSVPEDILHLIEDSRSFTYNRINPMTLKPAIEFITGRDAFGRQKSPTSQMEDFVKGIAPIPAQGYMNSNETTWLQSVLGAMGIQVTQYRTTAEQDAHKARMRMIPDTPEGKEDEAESRLKLKMEKDLRAGKVSTTDVWNAVKAGKLTPHAAGRAVRDAQMTALQKDFKALTIQDAMKVYAEATPAERLELKPELEAKRARTQKEKPLQARLLEGKLAKLLGS